MTHRILLVEDDAPTRRHLARAVEAQPGLVLQAAAASCAEAEAQLACALPDILLTDIGLPDGSGIDLIRRLRARTKDALAMVITALGDEKTVLAAVEAGASGYLLKDGSPTEIAEALRCLLDGGSPISPSIARKLLQRMHADPPAPRVVASTHDGPALSPRETEVLRLIAKGFSYPEISGLLGITAHTVTTHVRRIYDKLEVSSRGSAVYEAVQLGLIRLDE
jgi:DNA-binding NarL/FixJ family response regulator